MKEDQKIGQINLRVKFEDNKSIVYRFGPGQLTLAQLLSKCNDQYKGQYQVSLFFKKDKRQIDSQAVLDAILHKQKANDLQFFTKTSEKVYGMSENKQVFNVSNESKQASIKVSGQQGSQKASRKDLMQYKQLPKENQEAWSSSLSPQKKIKQVNVSSSQKNKDHSPLNRQKSQLNGKGSLYQQIVSHFESHSQHKLKESLRQLLAPIQEELLFYRSIQQRHNQLGVSSRVGCGGCKSPILKGPIYYCFICHLYLCGDCRMAQEIKQHNNKSHPLAKIENEQQYLNTHRFKDSSQSHYESGVSCEKQLPTNPQQIRGNKLDQSFPIINHNVANQNTTVPIKLLMDQDKEERQNSEMEIQIERSQQIKLSKLKQLLNLIDEEVAIYAQGRYRKMDYFEVLQELDKQCQ